MFKLFSKRQISDEEINKIKTYLRILSLWFKSKNDPRELLVHQRVQDLYKKKIEERKIITSLLSDLVPLLKKYKSSIEQEINTATKILESIKKKN
ncbi:hypothetical protein J4436_02720 [Candidatus Woesearchaeota archaeon]|nr:hypothetical protein [Candidatus Woesearchaeota archaeon]